jgi:hypothetical protein
MIQKLEDPPTTPPIAHPQKLGEELPVFCEKCGYQLHGLTPLRCEQCDILHFHCPECAHHQPINTLRPAFQTFLGRMRGAWLVLVVFFKILFFFWSLFAFGAAGAASSYGYDQDAWNAYQQKYQAQMAVHQAAMAAYQATAATQPANAQGIPPTPPAWVSPSYGPHKLDTPSRVGLSIMAIVFGMLARMMLLRWRRSIAVGAVLAGLVALAVVVGIAIYRVIDRSTALPWPWDAVFPAIFFYTSVIVLIGALIVWPIWVMLVKAFLPTRTGEALLAWQRSLSNRVSALAREPQVA